MDPLRRLLQEKRNVIKQLKKDKKAMSSYEQIKTDDKIFETEMFLKRFSAQVMEPVQIADIVINYKDYKKLLQRLKGFDVTERIVEDELVIAYSKPSAQGKGKAILYDLSHLFPAGSEFPEKSLFL